MSFIGQRPLGNLAGDPGTEPGTAKSNSVRLTTPAWISKDRLSVQTSDDPHATELSNFCGAILFLSFGCLTLGALGLMTVVGVVVWWVA